MVIEFLKKIISKKIKGLCLKYLKIFLKAFSHFYFLCILLSGLNGGNYTFFYLPCPPTKRLRAQIGV